MAADLRSPLVLEIDQVSFFPALSLTIWSIRILIRVRLIM
jgi:hypothetical protein